MDETKLQRAFMNIVNQMIEKECEFPDDFQLFYKIAEVHNRCGTHITIRPYLTKENAKAAVYVNNNWFYDKDTQEEIMTEERGENKRWCNSIIHITNSETCDRYDDDYIYRDYQCKHETGFRIDPKY